MEDTKKQTIARVKSPHYVPGPVRLTPRRVRVSHLLQQPTERHQTEVREVRHLWPRLRHKRQQVVHVRAEALAEQGHQVAQRRAPWGEGTEESPWGEGTEESPWGEGTQRSHPGEMVQRSHPGERVHKGVTQGRGYRGVSLGREYRGVTLGRGYRGVSLQRGYRGVTLRREYRGVTLGEGTEESPWGEGTEEDPPAWTSPKRSSNSVTHGHWIVVPIPRRA